MSYWVWVNVVVGSKIQNRLCFYLKLLFKGFVDSEISCTEFQGGLGVRHRLSLVQNFSVFGLEWCGLKWLWCHSNGKYACGTNMMAIAFLKYLSCF